MITVQCIGTEVKKALMYELDSYGIMYKEQKSYKDADAGLICYLMITSSVDDVDLERIAVKVSFLTTPGSITWIRPIVN